MLVTDFTSKRHTFTPAATKYSHEGFEMGQFLGNQVRTWNAVFENQMTVPRSQQFMHHTMHNEPDLIPFAASRWHNWKWRGASTLQQPSFSPSHPPSDFANSTLVKSPSLYRNLTDCNVQQTHASKELDTLD